VSEDTTVLHASSPPLNRMVIAVLSMVGLFVALYLMAHNLGLTGPIVCGVGDCGTVQSSVYAKVGPIPGICDRRCRLSDPTLSSVSRGAAYPPGISYNRCLLVQWIPGGRHVFSLSDVFGGIRD